MNEEYNEEEYMEALETNAGVFSEALPAIVREFQASAVEVSHYNDIPAGICFFNILGQVVKDFITIPNGRNHEDTRIHFCWVQTSGTGKSTLWNFVGPVAERTFNKINSSNKHPPFVRNNLPMNRIFNTFGVTDYTDSVLIGGYDKEVNDDGEVEYNRRPGVLEGNGLAHWDEFEYSGIFKQSQHKENSIVYLNTLMNSLAGESWIISKALTSFGGMIMECFCERSVLAMTYPPHKLESVMTEKGVLQRMLLFIWDVPHFIQDKMRRKQISYAGKIVDIDMPIDKHANALFKIYCMVKERWEEVEKDGLKVMKFSPEFNDVLEFEYEGMEAYIQSASPEVRKIASNFTTRLLKILFKMSVLCSVAQSRSITNKQDRFLVTGYNVRQAASIVRQCYMTLVDWLERSLRVRRRSMAEKNQESAFLKVFTEMDKDEEGYVSKKLFLDTLMDKLGLKKARIYVLWNENEHHFETDKQGRSVFIRLKGEKK